MKTCRSHPHRPLFFLCGLLTFAAVCTPGLAAQDAAGLERQVQQLFEQRCSECHGRDLPATKRKGNRQMFFDARSNRAELDRAKALVLGNPADSAIIQKVLETSEDDRMPPKGARLTPAQVALLRQWIAGGAADAAGGPPPATAIKRGDLFKAVLADLEGAAAGSRRHLRYLTLHNLRNAGDGPDALRAYRVAVSKTLNSLSSEPRIVVPVALDPERVLLRFDVRDYGWDAAKWDLLAVAYPYVIESGVLTRVERDIRQLTGTVVPIIRADWFVFGATQPPLYEQLLATAGQPGGLPDGDAKLEQQLGIDVLQNIRSGRVQRAAFTDSGVSDSNRMIERHALPQQGYYWKSYDFANERGAGDLVRNPLGPPETGYNRAFRHDGGEIIWSLPNGLQGYLLATASGTVIPRGPTGIVKDPAGPQGAVVNGFSCMRCHAAGMRPPKGGEVNIASTHSRTRGGLEEAEQLLFDRSYRNASEIARLLADDGERFKAASRQAGVTEASWFTPDDEPVFRLYSRFRADITARTLASELDMDPADVEARLKEYDGAGDPQMNSLIQRLPKGTKRQNFIADFALLSQAFERGTPRAFRPLLFEEFRETTVIGDVAVAVLTVTPFKGLRGNEYNNSLGMKFVPVPGTDVHFCIWETRKQDYEAYARAVPGVDGSWQHVMTRGQPVSFAPDHPVVGVARDEARRFCAWLTEKEQREGRIPSGARYRLPTDLEWSAAVGLPREAGATPRARDGGIPGVYPWGTVFPPPPGAGNFSDIAARTAFGMSRQPITGYRDGFATTSPVGSFAANQFGLFDLSGNVWEWSEDWYDGTGGDAVLRGGSWSDHEPHKLLSSFRAYGVASFRGEFIGFRCVLVGIGRAR